MEKIENNLKIRYNQLNFNKTMKSKWKILVFWSLLLGVMVGCEKEEPELEPIHYVNFHVIKPGEVGKLDYKDTDIPDDGSAFEFLSEKVPGAKVTMYRTYEDYLQQINPLNKDITDANGEVTFEVEDIYEDYYFRIEKGEFNDIRYLNEKLNSGVYDIWYRSDVDRVYTATMVSYGIAAKTPTKLAFQVYHQGEVVEGAQVQLYFSEDDYLNEVPAQENKEELLPSYGYWKPEMEAYEYTLDYLESLKNTFSGTTDADGYVLLENLEPRTYWFRITNGELSNAAGQINLSSPLPDNADITTQLDIGLQ